MAKATITRPSGDGLTLPSASNRDIIYEHWDWVANTTTFLEGTNINRENVDTTSSNAILSADTAQTITEKKTWSANDAAGSAVVEVARFGINPASGTPAANDGGRITLFADDAGGGDSNIAYIDWVMTTATAGSEVGRLDFYVASGGAPVSQIQITNGAIVPTTTDDISLGTSALNFSDLFLDLGAVVNFNSGDVTLTHTADTLTVAGGTWATAALTASTITGSGVLSVDDATDSTSGTTGSIHTDGGLGVVKDIFTNATLNAAGDTAAGDNAAIGYTSAEGLILTGQGSTNDVTIKNDADADVITIATGGTAVTFTGVVTATGFTIGSAVIGETELEILDGATVTTTELNLLDALDRGSIIYGNASGVTTVLGQGGSGTVLTSDGTDLSWASPAAGDITGVTAGVGLSGGGTSGTVSLALAFSELTDTAIANGDYIVFTDATDSNASVKGDLADVATLFAGTGLTASSSVIGVDAAQTGITSLLATDIKIGEDDQTKIDFETADEIHFYAANVEQVYLADNIFGPQSDSDVDLGTTGVRWKDAYIDSITCTDQITATGFTGTLDGILGSGAAAAATVTTLAAGGDVTIANGYGLVVGGTAQQEISDGDGSTGVTPEAQILGTTAADMTLLIGGWSTTATRAAAPTLAFLKSGDGTIGTDSYGAVTTETSEGADDHERLGSIIAYGDDGSDYESPAAAIEFAVDGGVATGDMPGRIVMYTTVDGGETLTEALRIHSNGSVTKPRNPAFRVYQASAQNNITGNGAFAQIAWGTESHDAGGDVSGAVFTAPATGLYAFNVRINAGGIVSGHTAGLAYMVTSSSGSFPIGGSIPSFAMLQDGETMFEGTQFITMDAGDTVYIQLYVTGGAQVVDVATGAGNHWEGFLVG